MIGLLIPQKSNLSACNTAVFESMNERQRRFAEFYAASGNAAQAAREAGYSARTARSIGQRLLTEVDISNYVRELQEKMESERIADAREVKSILTDIVRDEGAKRSDRIKAGSVLLRASGELLGQSPRAAEEAENADFDGAPETVVQLPYNGDNSVINAVQLEDGSVVPMLGAEDSDTLIYLPYKWYNAITEEDMIKPEGGGK